MRIREVLEERLPPASAGGRGERLAGPVGSPRAVPGLVADRRHAFRSAAAGEQGHVQPTTGRRFQRAQAGALGNAETDAITLVARGIYQRWAMPSGNLQATHESDHLIGLERVALD